MWPLIEDVAIATEIIVVGSGLLDRGSKGG